MLYIQEVYSRPRTRSHCGRRGKVQTLPGIYQASKPICCTKLCLVKQSHTKTTYWHAPLIAIAFKRRLKTQQLVWYLTVWLLFLSWMQGCRIGFLKPQKPNLLNLGFFILCNLMNKLYIKIVIVRLINFIFIFTWCSSPSLTGESLRTSYCVWDVFHVLLGSTLKTYVFQHCLSDTVVGFYYFLLLSALLVFFDSTALS